MLHTSSMADKIEEADELNSQGHNLWLAGHYQQAEQILESAILIYETENSDRVAQSLHNLGNLYRDTKRPEASLEILERSLAHFKILKRNESIVDVWTSMSLACLDLRQFEKMEKYLLQGLELVDSDDFSRIGDLEHNLALCYQRRFLFEDAENLFWRSYRTYEKISDEYVRKDSMLASINELLEFYDHHGNEDKFDDVLELKDELNN